MELEEVGEAGHKKQKLQELGYNTNAAVRGSLTHSVVIMNDQSIIQSTRKGSSWSAAGKKFRNKDDEEWKMVCVFDEVPILKSVHTILCPINTGNGLKLDHQIQGKIHGQEPQREQVLKGG